jgi:hypothetical protein
VHRGLSASVCDAIIEELIDRTLLISIVSAMNYQQDIPRMSLLPLFRVSNNVRDDFASNKIFMTKKFK